MNRIEARKILTKAIKRCIYSQVLRENVDRNVDVFLKDLDLWMDIAKTNGFGQFTPPQNLGRNIRGAVSSNKTSLFNDSVGNHWYQKDDFWIMQDDLLMAVEEHSE